MDEHNSSASFRSLSKNTINSTLDELSLAETEDKTSRCWPICVKEKESHRISSKRYDHLHIQRSNKRWYDAMESRILFSLSIKESWGWENERFSSHFITWCELRSLICSVVICNCTRDLSVIHFGKRRSIYIINVHRFKWLIEFILLDIDKEIVIISSYRTNQRHYPMWDQLYQRTTDNNVQLF